MKLYAITYTDLGEPWGAAVLDGKLYSTPTKLWEAVDAHFDAFLAAGNSYVEEGLAGGICAANFDWCRDLPNAYMVAMLDEYRQVFGVACYEVVA